MENTSDVNVMFFHGKTIDGSRFTISGVLDKNLLSLGIAVCGNGEQFKKEKGRLISTGRLLNQRHPELGGRIEYVIESFNENDKDFTKFTNEVSEFNKYSKKELLDQFGLRKPDLTTEYEEKRAELYREFYRNLTILNESYGR